MLKHSPRRLLEESKKTRVVLLEFPEILCDGEKTFEEIPKKKLLRESRMKFLKDEEI